jgi:hypothetical protein
MVGRGDFFGMTSTCHRRVCLNIYSLHLTTPRFLWHDHDIPLKRVFKCIEFTFNNPTVSLVSSSMVGRDHTKETAGLLNVNSVHLNTLFGSRSCSYQRNRGVVKCKLYTFKHPLQWYVVVMPKKSEGV